MAKIKDGGAAFPHMMAEGHRDYAGGMSLRDWLAGQAIGSVIRQCAQDLSMQSASTVPEEYFARKAYAIADAMLIARQLQEGEDA